jgi:hypothetical protein
MDRKRIRSFPVNTRVAEHAGRLYLDLADEHWRAVAIGPTLGTIKLRAGFEQIER